MGRAISKSKLGAERSGVGIPLSSRGNLQLNDGYGVLKYFVNKQFLSTLVVDGNKTDQANSTEHVKMHMGVTPDQAQGQA
jgi:hypothetical protein